MDNPEGALLVRIKAFFGHETLKAFREDWVKLTETDKEQIKTGFVNGSMTY